MRRGSLVLAVLIALREPHYGYSLRKKLQALGIDIEEGTLYPMIRRLAEQGYLNSKWLESGERKKRYYQLSDEGYVLSQELIQEWQAISQILDKMVYENGVS